MIAFPQSSGQLFSWYILLHSVYIISTELSSPACIISAVMLSSPGDFPFFRLLTAASTSSLSMSKYVLHVFLSITRWLLLVQMSATLHYINQRCNASKVKTTCCQKWEFRHICHV